MDHRRIGAFLEAHQCRDLGAERLPVEIEGLFAAAVEKQIGFDFHRASPSIGLWRGRTGGSSHPEFTETFDGATGSKVLHPYDERRPSFSTPSAKNFLRTTLPHTNLFPPPRAGEELCPPKLEE